MTDAPAADVDLDHLGLERHILLVEEVTDWCRINKVLYQARGSASGSMVCWLQSAVPVRWITRDVRRKPRRMRRGMRCR